MFVQKNKTMNNWSLLNDDNNNLIWEYIYDVLVFRPYSKSNVVLLKKPMQCFDISNHFGAGFNEVLYDDLHEKSISVFKEIVNDSNVIYALSWQHQGYTFSPYLHFEKDEFDEWYIPVFANGDFNFFLTKDRDNGVFADGVSMKIYYFGSEIIQALERNLPKMFTSV